MESKHTPTPWEYHPESAYSTGVISEPSGPHIAHTTERPEAAANARYIIRACNAHEELVGLVQEYLDGPVGDQTALDRKARALLARLEEE